MRTAVAEQQEKVQGTLAFQFHFGVTLGEQLTIWEQDLSRHLTLVPPTGTKSACFSLGAEWLQTEGGDELTHCLVLCAAWNQVTKR